MSKEYEHATLYKRYNDIHHKIFGESKDDLPIDAVDSIIANHLKRWEAACLLLHSAQSGNQESINIYLDYLDKAIDTSSVMKYVREILMID